MKYHSYNMGKFKIFGYSILSGIGLVVLAFLAFVLYMIVEAYVENKNDENFSLGPLDNQPGQDLDADRPALDRDEERGGLGQRDFSIHGGLTTPASATTPHKPSQCDALCKLEPGTTPCHCEQPRSSDQSKFLPTRVMFEKSVHERLLQ